MHHPAADGAALMDRLLAGPTNCSPTAPRRRGGERLPLSTYRAWFRRSSPGRRNSSFIDRWGPRKTTPSSSAPEITPFPEDRVLQAARAFALSIHRFGNVTVGLQTPPATNIDPCDTYSSARPRPGPYGYLAFSYLWLLAHWGDPMRSSTWASTAISNGLLPQGAGPDHQTCWGPRFALGPVCPNIYPFHRVNDPGGGARRRNAAPRRLTSFDHLTPPLDPGRNHGPLRLTSRRAAVDEYYEAAASTPPARPALRADIPLPEPGHGAGLRRDFRGLRGEAETDL